MSVGEALAGARGQAGLSVAQVSERTRIREAVIRAIEQDDYSGCGGDFYARGHIRSIARVVGADSGELIREYDAAHPQPHEITAAEVFEPSTPIRMGQRRGPSLTAVMAVVLVLLAGFGVYQLAFAGGLAGHPSASTRGHTGGHHAAGPHRSPSTSPTSPAPAASRGLVIQLTAIQDCWVEFTKPNGTYLTQATVIAGSSQTWHFARSVWMQIGNPAGIKLTVNGTSMVHPSGQTQPVTLRFSPGQPSSDVASG